MKRHTIILGMLVVLASHAYSQEVSLGIVGGVNWTDVKITTEDVQEDVNSRLGYGAGAVVSLHMSEAYSIELAPTFVRMSNMMERDNPNPDIDMFYNYLQVPLFFKLRSPGAIRTYVKAGPVVGILLKAETEVEFNGVPFTADFSDAMKALDLGLGVGLGVEIAVWKGNLFVEGRYVHGLNNVLEGGTVTFQGGGIELQEDIPMNSEARSRSVQVMMGYNFPLGSP